MPQPLESALAEVRALLLDPAELSWAVAAGHRRGRSPSVVRAELRPVRIKGGTRLQVVTNDGTRPYTQNLAFGAEAETVVDALLAEPFGNWHVRTTGETVQVRVTKSGAAQVHRAANQSTVDTSHDRVKEYLLDPADPLFDAIGGSAAKRRQVDAFLRALAAALPLAHAAPSAASLPPSTEELPEPLRVVDLGCGNAYLTFAAYRYLTAKRGIKVHLTGVDVREDQRARNTELAAKLGWSGELQFVAGTIADAPLDGADVVLALHACDTATDEALARAVAWRAPWILAAPCCHHDIAAQLRRSPAPPPYGLLTGEGILRERFADVLTDSLRAALLRQHGYRVEVVEFVDSAHTPRNLLIRARYTGVRTDPAEYASLVETWHVVPRLAVLLGEGRAG